MFKKEQVTGLKEQEANCFYRYKLSCFSLGLVVLALLSDDEKLLPFAVGPEELVCFSGPLPSTKVGGNQRLPAMSTRCPSNLLKTKRKSQIQLIVGCFQGQVG